MDNKKLLIIFVPVIVLIMGYVYYTDYYTPGTQEVVAEQGEFAEVKNSRDTVLKSRLERYKEKWEREKGLSRKVVNQDDFFGEEIKKDSVKPTAKEAIENFIEPTETDKPKTVIVYRDREPIKKEVVRDEPKKEDPVIAKNQGRYVKKEEPFKGNMGNVSSEDKNKATSNNAVSAKAIMHNEQKIFSGGAVILRLSDDLKLPNVTVPRNTFVTGTISFADQRALVTITTVTVNERIYNANLRAYDANDGVEGIQIPGGTEQEVSRDVLNDVISTATQQVKVPILNRQGSNAGRRKVNEQSIVFPSGYQVILKSIN